MPEEDFHLSNQTHFQAHWEPLSERRLPAKDIDFSEKLIAARRAAPTFRTANPGLFCFGRHVSWESQVLEKLIPMEESWPINFRIFMKVKWSGQNKRRES